MMSFADPRTTALVALLAFVSVFGVACSDGGTLTSTPTSTLLPTGSTSPGVTSSIDPSATGVPSTESPGPATSTLTPRPGNSTNPDGSPVSDAIIRALLAQKFAADPALLHIKVYIVSVKNGVVYIQARVAKESQKTVIEKIALKEPGVTKVISAIVVDPQNNGGPDSPY